MVGIELTGQTPPHFCTCSKPGYGVSTSFVLVFSCSNELELEVIFRFIKGPGWLNELGR